MDGRFSLAGAQTKDALHRKDGKWYLPGGRIPTTHILKPQPDDLEEHAVHEHFCLELVSRIGLSVAKSEVLEIGDMKVLNVERYDRLPDAAGARVVRLHQEDFCQALGYFPDRKYENEGGPSAADIVRLLRAESSDYEDDVGRFVMALAINWVIYGSDAHSKNYSLIHLPGSYLRLAPLYDIASNLPYEWNPKSTKRKLAMKVGGDYHLHRIARKSWRKFAEECGLDPLMVDVWVSLMIDKIEEHVRATAEQVSSHCVTDFIERLRGLILERVGVCRDAMG